MWLLKVFSSIINDFLKKTDEISEKVIYNEYYSLLSFSGVYPILKNNFTIFLFCLQMIYYYGVSLLHIYFLFVTALYNFDDFVLMLNSLNFASIILFFIIFKFIILTNRTDFRNIHRMIGIDVYIYENEEFENDEIKEIKRKNLNFKKLLKTCLPIVNIMGGFSVVIIGPYVDKFFGYAETRIYSDSGVNFLFPVPIMYPFEAHEGAKFMFAFFLQISLAFIVIIILLSCSSIYVTVCMNIIMQLDLLKYSIKNIEIRSKKLYEKLYFEKKNKNLGISQLYEDKDFMKCMELCLIQNIKHHQSIHRMHKLLLNLMKYILVITVGLGVAIVAVSGFLAISLADRPGGLFGLFMICSAQILNLLSVCYLGELISDMNNQLNFQLYSVNWYCYTKKIHQYLNIIQIYTTKDMAVTGPFSLIANMETFGTMMNSAYSYMSLLFAWNSS